MSSKPIARPWRLLAWLGVALLGAGVLSLAAPFVYYWGAGRWWDKAEPEVHLIPAGFRGPVLIIYNQPAGAPKEFEGKARLYRIPPDGVVRTQFGPNEGWGRPEYLYVDGRGHRRAIVPGTPCEDSLRGDPVQACLMGRRYRADSQPSPEYSEYVVSQAHDRQAAYEAGERLVDSLLFRDVP